MKNVTNYIADIICKRMELGFNYGVIILPEGLIDFIPEVKTFETSSSSLCFIVAMFPTDSSSSEVNDRHL